MITKELTKNDIRVLQAALQQLANELIKFAGSYKKMPILQAKGTLVGKYRRIQGYRNQVMAQMEVVLYYNNKEMAYLFSQENKLLGQLMEIFEKSRLGDDDLEDVNAYCAGLLQLLNTLEERMATLRLAA